MRLRTLLEYIQMDEMAVRNVDKVGDLSANADFETSSMSQRTDRKLMRHPKTEALIRKALSRFPQTIDVKIINDKDIREYLIMNVGHVSNKKIQQTLKYVHDVDLDFTTADINIVFTGDRFYHYTVGQGPLSAWMCIHRVWQYLLESPVYNVGEKIDRKMEAILIKTVLPNLVLMISPFMFRSARDKRVNSRAELFYELFTEYCMMGRIRYKPAREVWEFLKKYNPDAFDKPVPEFEKYEKLYNKNMKRINQMVAKMAQNVFKRIKGDIIVIY